MKQLPPVRASLCAYSDVPAASISSMRLWSLPAPALVAPSCTAGAQSVSEVKTHCLKAPGLCITMHLHTNVAVTSNIYFEVKIVSRMDSIEWSKRFRNNLSNWTVSVLDVIHMRSLVQDGVIQLL